MSVIATTHMNLIRARRQMETAFMENDWERVKEWDQLLTAQLNSAFDDPHRDNDLLVKELEKILGLYADMVESLPPSINEPWMQSETTSNP